MTVKKWKHSGTKKHSMSDREIRNGLLSEKAAEEGIVPVSYTHLDVYKRQECGIYLCICWKYEEHRRMSEKTSGKGNV